MTLPQTPIVTAAAAALMFSSAAIAGNDTRIVPGVQVQGSDGELLGTVEETSDGVVVVNTGNHSAPISTRSVERVDDHLRINATRNEIDRMMDEKRQAEAARRDAYLAPGRLVRSVDSKPIGRIVAIELDGESVVILRNEGVIALKPDHFAVIKDRLVALFTRAQIDEHTKPVPEVLRQRLAGMSAR